MVFNIQQPMIILFDELEELQQIYVTALNPYTGTQMVKIGLKLNHIFYDFEKGLISWLKRPVVEHMLINLKHILREIIKRYGGLEVRQGIL